MAGRRPPRLALDHNFPTPFLRALDTYIVDVELITLRDIDARLPTLDDRQLVIALHQLGFPGLVTNNYKMLKNPKELAAIIATRLTVFAIEGVGDDPLRATGALLLDLPGALKKMDTRRPQVFWMKPRNPLPQNPAGSSSGSPTTSNGRSRISWRMSRSRKPSSIGPFSGEQQHAAIAACQPNSRGGWSAASCVRPPRGVIRRGGRVR